MVSGIAFTFACSEGLLSLLVTCIALKTLFVPLIFNFFSFFCSSRSLSVIVMLYVICDLICNVSVWELSILLSFLFFT